jgi:hypothetical protein
MIYHLPPGVTKAQSTPHKARPVGWFDVQRDQLKKGPQAIRTSWCALAHGHSKDHMMARLDDTTRALGVAGIAGLGSLGVNQPGASLPLWLGGASWLGAMAITPQVINTTIRMKTGVNLNSQYMSSNGDIRPLFQDPNYLVTHVIPVDTRIKLAKQLGIPVDHPDGLELLQAKLKQISVQGHTWWMLMAGMATPVLASLICDRLETPLKGVLTDYRQWNVQRTQLLPALASKKPEAIAKAVQATFQTAVGTGTDVTPLSRWWQQMPQDIIKALNLNGLSQQDLLHPNPQVRFDRVVAHLEGQFGRLESKVALQNVLREQQKTLNQILAPLETLLQREEVKTALPRTAYAKIAEELELVRATAEGTMQHFKQLLSMSSRRGISRPVLKEQMEKSVLSYLEQLLKSKGEVSRAISLAGGQEQYTKVIRSFAQERFGPAFVEMGASPKALLMKGLESLGLKRRWYQRFPGIVGLGMLAATAVYIFCFVGENFGAPASNKGGERR